VIDRQARDPSAKAIVFSQFVNMLDLIMWRLTLEGIKVRHVAVYDDDYGAPCRCRLLWT
jgi:hypothetical protein